VTFSRSPIWETAKFEWKDVARLAAMAAAPLLPLALLAFSAEELFDKIVMIIFG
jgi:hypothetical protein